MRGALAAGLLVCAALSCPARAGQVPKAIGVGVDPRLELLGVVQLIDKSTAAPDGFQRAETPYVRDAQAWFSRWRDHEAVRLNAGLNPAAFDFMKRGDILVRHSPLPEMVPMYFIPDMFVDMAGGRPSMERWIGGLRSFAKDARLADFLKRERSTVDPPVAAFRRSVDASDYIGTIERYTGLTYDGGYSVLLSPFFRHGNMVNSVLPLDDGRYEIRSVIGPEVAPSGELDFRPDRFPATAWHELSHGLLDTAGDLYQDEIARNERLFGALPWNCYGTWLQCVKEHVVRAVMIRLIMQSQGAAAGQRQLADEGEQKFPYLRALVERLGEYEASRDRYPDLVGFYPRLLEVFPPGNPPSPPAAEAAALPSGDPGPEWIVQASYPFATDGQRARAASYLDLVIAKRPDPERLRRRAVMRFLLKDYSAAAADASAALEKAPGDVGARLIRGSALMELRQPQKAREDFVAAGRACRSGAGPVAACRNVLMRLGGVAPAGAASADATRVAFEVDARIELLSSALMLAYPKEFRRQFGERLPAFAAAARAHFSPWAGHPLVRRLQKLLAGGMDEIVPAQILLSVSGPPELSAGASGATGYFPKPEEEREFLSDLRDFSVKTGFSAFFEAHQADYDEFLSEARREASRALAPEAASSYMRTAFRSRYRFVLAPLMPARFDANLVRRLPDGAENVRIRSPYYDNAALDFVFGDFASGVAHELVHTVTDPLAESYRDELGSYAGLLPPGCAQSWMGCVLEHVDLAITLRAWRQERGDKDYQDLLKFYVGKGFPYLPALCDRLQDFEAHPPSGGIASFYPRLVDVFREALLAKVHGEARRKLESAQFLRPPARRVARAPVVSADFSVDPRFELLSVILRLGDPASRAPAAKAAKNDYRAAADRQFGAFAAHPVVERVSRLLKAEPGTNLPAQLMVYLSEPPELSPWEDIPDGYVSLAGGQKSLDELENELRDFAQKTNFQKFFEAHRDDYGRFGETARQQAPREDGSVFLSALLPPGDEAYMTLVGKDQVSRYHWRPPSSWAGGEPTFYTASVSTAAFPGDAGAEGFAEALKLPAPVSAIIQGSSPQIAISVDPRVELVSAAVLLADGRTPGSDYGRQVKKRFAAFASDPAVAQIAGMMERRSAGGLALQLVYRLAEAGPSSGPESVPVDYLSYAGGPRGVRELMKAAGDFAQRSRFAEFFEEHRAFYRDLVSRAEAESLKSISPAAAAAYLGQDWKGVYDFKLAPLLPERFAMSLSLGSDEEPREVRIRPGVETADGNFRFMLDAFGNSVSHELIHSFTDALVPSYDGNGLAPPLGCNDQMASSWGGCIQEHIVYAVSLRLLARDLGEAPASETLRQYAAKGFPYLGLLNERLKQYEAQRPRYPTLREFYPRLEEAIRSANAEADTGAKAKSGGPAPLDSRNRELKDRGVKEFQEGRYRDALETFRGAIKARPQDAEALLDLGVVAQRMGDSGKALDYFGQAISSGLADGGAQREILLAALSSRAALLESLHQLEKAQKDLEQALEAAPGDWEGRSELRARLEKLSVR